MPLSLGFHLGFFGKRNVHGHLVAVEVGVESVTDERMHLNSVAFNQNRLECLNTEAMQESARGSEERTCL